MIARHFRWPPPATGRRVVRCSRAVISHDRSPAVRKSPFVGDAHQIDAAACVFRPCNLRQCDLDVDARRGHPLGQRRLVDRLGGSKQQRFPKRAAVSSGRISGSFASTGTFPRHLPMRLFRKTSPWLGPPFFHLLDRQIRRGHRPGRLRLKRLRKIQRRRERLLFLVSIPSRLPAPAQSRCGQS